MSKKIMVVVTQFLIQTERSKQINTINSVNRNTHAEHYVMLHEKFIYGKDHFSY